MYPCELREYPDRQVLSIKFRSPVGELPQHFSQIYTTIANYMTSIGVVSHGPAFATYLNMDMDDLDVEAGFMVPRPVPGKDQIIASTVPSGTFAVCHYTGPYSGLGSVYDELQNFAKEQGYAVGYSASEWYLNGPETKPEALKTDVELPVTRMHEGAHA